MPEVAALVGVPVVLQEAGTSATGNGLAVSCPYAAERHAFYVSGSAGIASGAVTFETAPAPDYTGTWDALVNDKATPTANPMTAVASKTLLYQYYGKLQAVRARISTVIGSGTIEVTYVCN